MPVFGSKAEMLRELVERRGKEREECLMVGDTAEDAHAAEALALRVSSCRTVTARRIFPAAAASADGRNCQEMRSEVTV